MQFFLDNQYLGNAEEIEVWTISGFINPLDVEAQVGVEGWKFLFRRESEEGKLRSYFVI